MWELFSPYITSAAIGAYLYFIFSTKIIDNVGHFIIKLVTQLIVEWNWGLIAPILWLVAIYATCKIPSWSIEPPPEPDEAPPPSRKQRRHRQQHYHRESNRR